MNMPSKKGKKKAQKHERDARKDRLEALLRVASKKVTGSYNKWAATTGGRI